MENKTPINIKIGGQIPAFAATDHEGNPVTEKDLSGKKHILFFYAQDDTPTCTKEACSLRDDYSYFKESVRMPLKNIRNLLISTVFPFHSLPIRN
jgi:peroxiredoxin